MSTPPPLPPLAKKIVVEPLSDDRLTRIERTIVSRAVEPAPVGMQLLTRWLSLAVAVGATAIVAGTLGWVLHGKSAHHAGPQLATAPVSVHTEGSSSTIDIGDATIASSPNTAFAVTRPDGGVLVEMTRGRIELDVAKRGTRPPLVVHAGDTDVIVVGTHFIVDFADGQKDVDVRVQEGRVRIVRQSREVDVSMGQEWSSHDGTVVALAEPTAAPEPGQPTPAVPTPAVPTPVDTPPPSPNPTQPKPNDGPKAGTFEVHVGPTPKVLHDHVAAVPDPNKKQPATPPKPVPAATPVDVAAAGSDCFVTRADGSMVSCGAKNWDEQRRDPAKEIQNAVRNVRLPALLPAVGPDGAAAPDQAKFYRDKSLTTDADASRALYSLAQYQAVQQGRTDDALASLSRYTGRFGHGAELGSVLWLRVRILCLRSVNTACHEAAQIYLDKASGGPGEHVADLITATPQ